jgi:hypothetical protein
VIYLLETESYMKNICQLPATVKAEGGRNHAVAIKTIVMADRIGVFLRSGRAMVI